jgi:CubicO group peptidase (beta-lactamase class C family)
MSRTVLALAAALVAALPVTSTISAQTVQAERVDSLFSALGPATPGVAVAVIQDGQLLLERGYGSAELEHGVPITPSTVFHVASVTKQFTAFAIALLAARGELSLDDDVRTHIPELPELGHTLTLRQLIHHTSGIRDQWELLAMAGWRLDDVITKDHILALATRQRALNFAPGTEHLYSNLGYTLLAEVVERVGGRPFPEWMGENVFRPLGMASTHMHDNHERMVPGRAYSYRGGLEEGWRNAVLSYANAGATSLFTTVGDLAKWLRNFETAELGGPDLVSRMRERAVLANGDTLPYAFAIVRGEHRGRTTWSHGGADAGFRTTVLHFPAERLGVVVLSNAASFNPGAAAAAVADIYLGESGSAPFLPSPVPPSPAAAQRPTPPRLDAAQLAAFAGDYFSPELEAIYRVAVVDDGLVARHVRHGEIRLDPAAKDAFTSDRWFFRRVTFTRDEAGRVDGLRVTGGRVRDLRFERLGDGALPW